MLPTSTLLLSFIIPFAVSDVNVFDPRSDFRPLDTVVEVAGGSIKCTAEKKGECDLVKLTMTAPVVPDEDYTIGNHSIFLRKTFTLDLKREVCHYYISKNVTQHATLRVCDNKEKHRKISVGTFFDEDLARIDFDSTGKDFLVVRSRRNSSDSEGFVPRSLLDQLEVKTASHLFANLTWVPELGDFKQPVIELFLGIDPSMLTIFTSGEDALLKYVCTIVNSADALWSMNGIRIKLTGVRFWYKLPGFTNPTPRSLYDLLIHYQTFIFGFEKFKNYESWFSGVMDYGARRGPDRIPGSPDVTMTICHWDFGVTNYGIAETSYDAKLGSSAIMDVSFAAHITLSERGFQHMHYFGDSMTLAHEVAHVLSLPHVPEAECQTERGVCVMNPYHTWKIPLWTKRDQSVIRKNLDDGTYKFLMKQNVHHHDYGTVHTVERMDRDIRCLAWFFAAAVFLMDALIFMMYSDWKQANVGRAGYQPLLHQD